MAVALRRRMVATASCVGISVLSQDIPSPAGEQTTFRSVIARVWRRAAESPVMRSTSFFAFCLSTALEQVRTHS